MKLRTKLKEIVLIAAAFGIQDMGHDALAAHALMQALRELRWQDTDDAIKRADELLREWGYE